MNVRQISIAYVQEHDRILARINSQDGRELQFWLTRRLALGMASVIDAVVTEQAVREGGLAPEHAAAMDPLSKKTVADFQRAETLRTSDFSTPYQEPAAGELLFDQPLLLTEIQISALGSGQVRLSCAEKLSTADTAHPRSFQMLLSQELVHAFGHLLERAVAQSQWRDMAVPAARAEIDAPDAMAAALKRGYLN